MDLQFPHHECEIAQSTVCNHKTPARYWLHNNMITINGKKMGKSYNNVIKLSELFAGTHPILEQPYHPMTIRFFILQSHYRSTLDFSNEALQSAEKGMKRLWEAYENLQKLSTDNASAADTALDQKVQQLLAELYEFMNDDLNTAKVLANLFELAPIINSIRHGQTAANAVAGSTIAKMQQYFHLFLEEIFGLKAEQANDDNKLGGVLQLLIDIRKDAKSRKDYVTSDKIRNELATLGIQLKDEKDGSVSWSINN
jgi:cysteinyl-tRNA synthetase